MAADRANAPSTEDLSGLTIHCSDAHLVLTDPANAVYRDMKLKTRVQVPLVKGTLSGPSACGGNLQGFEYSFPAGQIIVLCSDGPKAALRMLQANSLESWRAGGNLGALPVAGDKGIDYFESFLSYKILHELMHAASESQCELSRSKNTWKLEV